MAIEYPSWLPLAQKPSKAMTFDDGFRTDQPAVGAPIFQKLTDDLKTTWNLTWVLTLSEERAFQMWLRSPNYLDNCTQWFVMPINLGGSGLQPQELHFTSYPVQASINGNVVTWTGTVVARELFNDDDQFDDIIIELSPDWYSWLDEVVNRDLPQIP